MLLAGAAFDLPSLYVPGAALGILTGGALAWVDGAARGARLERVRGPSTVVEDEPYPLRLRLRRGLLPFPGGELTDPLLERPLPLEPAWREGLTAELRFARRGRRQLVPATLAIHDPLRLHARTIASADGGELLVLPRVEPVEIAPGAGDAAGESLLGGGELGAGGGALEARMVDVEIDGLRPHRYGSPAARIHWPTVARTGELHERRLVAGADSSALVALDASAPADEQSLDRAVRAAASLCLHLARRGGCGLLLTDGSAPLRIDPRLSGWPEAHARLALVEAGAPAPDIARRAGAGAVFWVSADARAAAPPALARIRAPGAYLVTPFVPRDGRPAFRVAGCGGYPLTARRRLASARGGMA
jgi:uncharacterized protein (DUF58 family)